ncbi:MAG: glutamate--tRNA ligase [Candidatus Omnitrophota bacterium]
MYGTNVVVRFAPSPTGHLHIGGVRTALFNWAFARHTGGKFILRIEDTDLVRSSETSMLGIVQDFRWLGIEWDEGPNPDSSHPMQEQLGGNGPYFQSQRLEIYNKYVDILLQSGHAYECFLTDEELDEKRREAPLAGKPGKYDRQWALSAPPEKIRQYRSEGREPAIRFKMPDAPVFFTDHACGVVTCQPEEFEDFVIRRSNGYPTYHLASVIDDYLMGVTHILRGQEHRTNTFRHWPLQEALGFPHPEYCHFPLIFNPDGSKMSKRDKAKAARTAAGEWLQNHSLDELAKRSSLAVAELNDFVEKKSDDASIAVRIADALKIELPEIDVADFRNAGYIPEALLNYLALLGWNPGDDVEIFSLDFLVERFDLMRVGSSNARFDRQKLLAFNAEYLQKMPLPDFAQRLRRFCEEQAPRVIEVLGEAFPLFCEVYQKRTKTLRDPLHLGEFFAIRDEDVSFEEKAVKDNLLKNDGAGLQTLRQLLFAFEPLAEWTHDSIVACLQDFLNTHNINMKKTAQPIRVAISGNVITPEIVETLIILGKTKTVNRIKRCLERFFGE